VEQPLRYMAREFDDVSGLYYVRARWYDPAQGRFVSEDPIGLAGGINMYSYVGNSPTNFRDPSGLAPCTIAMQGLLRSVGVSEWIIGKLCDGGLMLGGITAVAGGSDRGPSGMPSTGGGPGGPPGGSEWGRRFGGGIIVSAAGSAEGGLGLLGAVLNGSLGGGAFMGTDCGASVGVHATGGAFVGGAGGPGTIGYPGGRTAAGSGYHFALGAAAGKGGSVTYTNATSMGQMRGPFENFTVSSPLGGVTISWGPSAAGPITSLTISGPSVGVAISQYATNTAAATLAGVGHRAPECR
jgi:RHS repeat-associated protein